MNRQRFPSRVLRRALFAFLLVLLGVPPSVTAAQSAGAPADSVAQERSPSGIRASADRQQTTEETRNSTDDAGFPEPFALSLLLMVVCGAVGAFAADLISDGGRIERPGRFEAGYLLGFLGKMVVGSIAAVIALSLNPSGEALWSLIGTALTAGLGGEAILLSRVAALQAQDEKKDRQSAERDAQRLDQLWAEKLETLRALAVGTHQDVIAEAGNSGNAVESGTTHFERIIDTYVVRAREEMKPARAWQADQALPTESSRAPAALQPAPTA